MMESASAHPASRRRLRIVARKRDAWFLVAAAVIVVVDQLVKWLIRHTIERGESVPEGWPIHLVHVTNSGAAFGILQGSGPLLAVTSVIGMVAILIYLFTPAFAQPLMRAGLALMLAGAVGNLIDRVAEGEVVDFVKFPHFPAFNVADSSITIGVLLLLWAMMEDPKPTTAES
ncbi:hypothetical protein AYO38_05145 [bacterium SCGC AG-212-C10]|nr:hypothetical protein AYO38_05145 [bacterium SCGC AG-212-C10]